MNRAQIFLLAVASLLAGLVAGQWLVGQDQTWSILWFGLSWLFFILWLAARYQLVGRLLFKINFLALAGLFLFLGLWRSSGAVPSGPQQVSHYVGQQLSLIGRIVVEPDNRLDKQLLTVQSRQLWEMAGQPLNVVAVQGKILLTTELFPQYAYGDWLSIRGKIVEPSTRSDFAYDLYLSRFDIYALSYYPQIELLASQPGWPGRWLRGKQAAAAQINKYLPQPEAALAQAMLLGYKRDLSAEWQGYFSQAGLSHLIAISGLHIGIISLLIFQLFLRLGWSRRWVFWLTSTIMWLYILLIGCPASAWRAGLMGQLALLAVWLGRLNQLGRSLLAAVTVMLAFNPRLLFDPGWQLSVAAMLGLVFFYPVLKKGLLYLKSRCWAGRSWSWPAAKQSDQAGYVLESLAVSLAAQLATWPLVAWHFKQLSVAAPLANLLVIPSLPVVLVSLVAALGLSWLLPSLGQLAWWPSFGLLHYITAVAAWLASWPGSSWQL